MVEKVATAAASKGSATVTAVKMSAMLFLLTRIGGFVFGAWWGLTALPVLRSMLQVAQLPNLEATLDRILGVTLFPFTMAILVVLAPLFGWWIYSRVEKPRQDVVGWLGALFYVILDASLVVIFSGIQQQLGFTINIIALAIGEAVVVLWLMFFMGIGFNIAKLFKAPL